MRRSASTTRSVARLAVLDDESRDRSVALAQRRRIGTSVVHDEEAGAGIGALTTPTEAPSGRAGIFAPSDPASPCRRANRSASSLSIAFSISAVISRAPSTASRSSSTRMRRACPVASAPSSWDAGTSTAETTSQVTASSTTKTTASNSPAEIGEKATEGRSVGRLSRPRTTSRRPGVSTSQS